MEKIKLFAKKNNEEKKDDRKLIEKIGDWFNDEKNQDVISFGLGIAIGVECVVVGYFIGKKVQYSKDNKEFKAFLKYLDDGFKEMQPKYINFDELIKINAIKGSRPSLKITGLDIYGKPITKVIGTDVQTAKKLADDLGTITDQLMIDFDANAIADQMRAAGMKNVQVF